MNLNFLFDFVFFVQIVDQGSFFVVVCQNGIIFLVVSCSVLWLE